MKGNKLSSFRFIKDERVPLPRLIYPLCKRTQIASHKEIIFWSAAQIQTKESPVAEGRHSGEDPEASSADDHREFVRVAPGDCLRVGDGEDHEGDAGEQVADVEEQKTPKY